MYNQQIAAGFNAGADNPMALYTAARYDNISRARELLGEGANPNAKNNFGHYPLHGAIMSSSPDTNMVVLLIDYGAEVDVRLSPKGPKSPNQWTPLFYAVYYGYTDIAEILIENGADVNLKDIWGDRPLHFARERGHEDMIRLLKEHGAKE